jgi:mannose-6-phosphate isomerase
MTASAPAKRPAVAISLPPNQPTDRFYRGGRRIDEFRRGPRSGARSPEDWIGSTTCVRGHCPVGRTRLDDGTTLAESVAATPEWWLGAEHCRRFGADTKLLVKLLDAGQRLPVHAHPHRDFARTHLGSAHGKAEAWYILTPGVVRLGLNQDVDPHTAHELVTQQQVRTLLAAMHEIAVEPGDRVYVPPGVLHSIGEGILLAEVQEPEDLSILLEWDGFDLDGMADGHLGLGFRTALDAVELRARTGDEVRMLVERAGSASAALPTAADEYFRLDRVALDRRTTLDAGFAIVIVLDGTLALRCAEGAVAAGAGSTLLVPAAAGEMTISGSGTILAARPPAP